MKKFMKTATALVLMLALLFGFASSRQLMQPLREMAVAARRFGRGDLSVRVEVDSSARTDGRGIVVPNGQAEVLHLTS